MIAVRNPHQRKSTRCYHYYVRQVACNLLAPKGKRLNYQCSGRFRKVSGRVAGSLSGHFRFCCSSGRSRKVSGRVAGSLFHDLCFRCSSGRSRKVSGRVAGSLWQIVCFPEFWKIPEGSGKTCRKGSGCCWLCRCSTSWTSRDKLEPSPRRRPLALHGRPSARQMQG